MTSWQLWLHMDLGHEAVLGAIGEHSCASLSELMHQLSLGDVPTLVDAPPPTPIPCVVAVDALVLARDPDLARLLPDGAGCLLVAPEVCSDDAIDDARTALGARPPWTVLCESGIGGWFTRKGPYGEALEAIYECAALVSLGLYRGEALARAGAQHRDALLRCRCLFGEDNKAAIAGRTLEQMLRWDPYEQEQYWRRVHAHQVLSVLGPVLPEFRALIAGLPARPDGEPFDVEVLSYEDQDPMPSRKTWWEAYRLEWFRRAGGPGGGATAKETSR